MCVVYSRYIRVRGADGRDDVTAIDEGRAAMDGDEERGREERASSCFDVRRNDVENNRAIDHALDGDARRAAP